MLIPDIPTDLRCDHCGQLVVSDRDEGSEDFWHPLSSGGTYYCCDVEVAKVGRYRKVQAWHDAGRPASLYAEPEMVAHALDDAVTRDVWKDAARAAGWIEPTGDTHPAWLTEMVGWAKANGCLVHISITGGER